MLSYILMCIASYRAGGILPKTPKFKSTACSVIISLVKRTLRDVCLLHFYLSLLSILPSITQHTHNSNWILTLHSRTQSAAYRTLQTQISIYMFTSYREQIHIYTLHTCTHTLGTYYIYIHLTKYTQQYIPQRQTNMHLICAQLTDTQNTCTYTYYTHTKPHAYNTFTYAYCI